MQAHDWQTIVKTHGPAVWQTAYRLLGNAADAADCFQESFLAALELSRRQSVRNMAGLLVRLATTRAIDRMRQKSRWEKRCTGPLDAEPIAAGGDPLDTVQNSELASHLREAIRQLPVQEAEVFCLRYLNDMSYRQIGRQLNMATSAVGVALYRAKARLRAALAATSVNDDEVIYAKEKERYSRRGCGPAQAGRAGPAAATGSNGRDGP